ncbi:MAG: MGMT family protein [Planctomycetota bacterium]|nr:MGMT family protein [Planctomycetota bacterium]
MVRSEVVVGKTGRAVIFLQGLRVSGIQLLGEPSGPAKAQDLCGAASAVERFLNGEEDALAELEADLDVHQLPKFTRRTLQQMLSIPRGETISYGELAKKLGRSGSARAVGGACARNPIPILIPCHRVVSANGPGGFSSGLAWKRRLLAADTGDINTFLKEE